MIDFFMRYATEAEAIADSYALAEQAGFHKFSDAWLTDHTLPDVKAWRPSQNTMSGDTPPQVVRHFLTGYYVLVSLRGRNQTLLNAAALAFCLDRDACNRGDPFVVKNNIGAVIQDIGVEPTFAGSNYPIGGFAP
jgi:hypothetical protein